MIQQPDRPVTAYSLAVFALRYAVNTFLQSASGICQSLEGSIISLMVCPETAKATRMTLLLTLMGISTHFALSIQVRTDRVYIIVLIHNWPWSSGEYAVVLNRFTQSTCFGPRSTPEWQLCTYYCNSGSNFHVYLLDLHPYILQYAI